MFVFLNDIQICAVRRGTADFTCDTKYLIFKFQSWFCVLKNTHFPIYSKDK